MNIKTMPNTKCDFVTQSEFENAYKVIESCYAKENAIGMKKRHFSPGGMGDFYGNDWWSLDYALIVDGAKWFDFSVAEDMVDNLLSTQCEDGRVKLYGFDTFYPKHTPYYDSEKIASIPKYFETAYQTARMSQDELYIKKSFTLLDRSLTWWIANRQDKNTKLVSAMFEETFIPNTVSRPLVYAPVDTNIELINGCNRASALAVKLGQNEKAEFYKQKASEILEAVDKYLWNEQDGCFYPYILTKNTHQKTLMATTFLGLYTNDKQKNEKLLKMLVDDSHFNWNTYPLTTVSKKDELFQTVTGDYIGNPSWSGSVWTLTNYAVIKALLETGKKDVAMELVFKTIECFKDNYAEFVNPFTRSGEGVQLYGWTASQFVQIIIEIVFGISYDKENGISVKPQYLKKGNSMSIENLCLPDGKTYSVYVDGEDVRIESK